MFCLQVVFLWNNLSNPNCSLQTVKGSNTNVTWPTLCSVGAGYSTLLSGAYIQVFCYLKWTENLSTRATFCPPDVFSYRRRKACYARFQICTLCKEKVHTEQVFLQFKSHLMNDALCLYFTVITLLCIICTVYAVTSVLHDFSLFRHYWLVMF